MKYLLAQLVILLSLNANASHIAAGEMYYDYLGNDNYEIHVLIYRDCAGAGFDAPLSLTIFDASNSIFQIVDIPLDTATVETVDYSTITTPTCLAQVPNACLEYFTYSKVINLPPAVGGYTLSYQRCCLTPQIINMIDPNMFGYTFTSTIPGVETGHHENSSPRFQGHSLFLACVNETIDFSHAATDPDGDSLVYSLVTPFQYDFGPGGLIAEPNPELPPPYLTLSYDSGFSDQDPLGLGGILTIDSMTGLMTVQPTLIGQFAIGVKVDEYRSDTLVGSTYRNLNMQSEVSNIGIEENTELNLFSVSPNPVLTNVEIHSTEAHSLTVFSSEGKIILEHIEKTNESYKIDMSLFDSGVYYFQFETDSEYVTKKVLR